MFSRAKLADDFRRLGVAPGDTVMLHASIRAVGEVAGGPDQIHLALKDALTPAGTLLMYCSCPRFFDEVGRGHLTPAEEAGILEKLPAFDPLTARCDRSNGALVELLRTWPGSRVNLHVARFVVWGRHSEFLLSQQPWSYAFGENSALDRFTRLDGRILLLGSDPDAVTYLHYVEHVGDFPGKRVARFLVPVDEHGERIWRPMEEFDTADGAHPNWPPDFFAQIVNGYLDRSGNRGGLVGNARSFLFSARQLFHDALPVMQSVAGESSA